MLPGIDRVIQSIRSRSRAEWQQYFDGRLASVRDYVQNHGERAAVIGFAIGIFVVLFFKITLFVVSMAALAYLTICIVAEA